MPSARRKVIAQCTEYSIQAFGGTEALVGTLLRGLSPHYDIVLVSNDESEFIGRSQFSSLIASHIPWRPDGLRHDARKLAGELRTRGVELAHFHFGGNYGWGNRALNCCPLIHAHRAGIPCVSTNHGAFALLDGYCASWRPAWVKAALLPAAWLAKMQVLWHCEMEIAVSQNDLRNLRSWYFPLRKKFRQIYHSKIASNETPGGCAERDKRILSVGSIGLRKGQTILTRAFLEKAAAHTDWKLLLAGRKAEGSLVEEIEKICKRLPAGRIQLLDHLNDDEITELMQTSEIFALPSLLEGLGLSLQEALFHGCACIGSRTGGIPELIDHEVNGLLVAPGNTEQLALTLDRLITDSSLRQRLRAEAPAVIVKKEMTAEQMTQKYFNIFQEILGP